MSGDGGEPFDAGRLPPPGRVAADWTELVPGTATADPVVAGLCEDVTAVLTAPAFEYRRAVRVGADLVVRQHCDSDALVEILDLLGARYVPLVSGHAQLRRLTRTFAAIVVGYVDAARGSAATRSAGRRTDVRPVGARGRVVDMNHALREILGPEGCELLGRSLDRAVRRDGDPLFRVEIESILAGSPNRGRRTGSHRSGDPAAPERDGRPRHVVTRVDGGGQRHSGRHPVGHDVLTGLPDRASFVDRVEQALDEPARTPFGACVLDVNGFRAVNDGRGHRVGDQLLRLIAARLLTVVEPPRDLVARLGGDEFVLLVGDGPAAVRSVARAALERVREPFVVDGREIRVSASVGVVEQAARCADPVALLQALDSSVSWAKAAGRDRVVAFDPRRYRAQARRHALAADIPGAVERGEFVVEFQPLVRLRDRSPVGAEALVRWRRPDGLLLGPDEFIGPAERTGAIVELGADVLRRACRDARAWADARPGRSLLLSVNVAARQLAEPDVVDTVTGILAETGWPPDALQLEITERAVTPGRGAAARLRELADAGVRIAIDDFGTGYSNLAYLHTLPVHALKLAGVFAMEAMRGGSLLSAVVTLAHSQHLEVTAEEVETAEQAERLVELGCDLAQGWYFGRPGSLDDV